MSIRKWSITTLCCVVIFGALALFKVMEIRAAIAFGESFPEHSETVEEARVESAQYTPVIEAIGEMVAPQRLDLRNELAGEITHVNFRSGDTVTKGQILLQLDTSVETANLAAAKARAQLAQSVYARSQNLFKSKATSKDQLDRAKADVSTSLAEVEALKRTISKKTLKSPFNGRAGLHNFEVGQLLMDNTFITTLIADHEYIWVDFKVPQFYPPLSLGTPVAVSTIGDQRQDAVTEGQVIAENTIINANNRSRQYRAQVPNNGNQFMANNTVIVKVPVGEPMEVMKIPALAVQQDPLGQFVFILKKDEAGKGYRASRRQVGIQTLGSQWAYVKSGLKPGDHIAAAGAFKLHEGLLVYTGERPVLNQE